jgi:hypothetical protein
MNIANSPAFDELVRRICAEYTEMPGLRVTHDQARRLWGIDADTCQRALDCLVDIEFLTITPAGQYARVTNGPVRRSNLQMLRARVPETRRRARAE